MPERTRTIKFLTSMRLTVVLLALGVALVFFGTLAQVNEGLYAAQSRWFRSIFVWWTVPGTHWSVPIFPGGYLIGGLLLINLTASHLKRFRFTWDKAGIHVIHAGIILLLVGQLATDLLSRESQVHFFEGETRKFTESSRVNELVFLTDADVAGENEVVSIPESMLRARSEIRHEKLPFTVRVREYWANAGVRQRDPDRDTNAPPANKGVGVLAIVEPQPESHDLDRRNMPCAVIELIGASGSMGTWLVSTYLSEEQEIIVPGKIWRIALRWERQYLPYSIKLLKTTHEDYAGTDIPKNFQSRVRIENPARGENREVDIYMNNPLRYEGLTFYQYQMGRDEMDANRGSSVLMAVRNPSWLTPYLGCALVGIGMAVQFLMHLTGFIAKRRKA